MQMRRLISKKISAIAMLSVMILCSCGESSSFEEIQVQADEREENEELIIPDDATLQAFIVSRWNGNFDVDIFNVIDCQVFTESKTAQVICSLQATTSNQSYTKSEEWKLDLTYSDDNGWECMDAERTYESYALLVDMDESKCLSMAYESVPADAENIKIENLTTNRITCTAEALISYEYISDYFKDGDNVFGDAATGYEYPKAEIFGSVTVKEYAVEVFSYSNWDYNPGWVRSNYYLTDDKEYIYNLAAHISNIGTFSGGGIDCTLIVDNNVVTMTDGSWEKNGASASISFSNPRIQFDSNEWGKFSDDSHLCIVFEYTRGESGNPEFPAATGIGYLSFFGGNTGGDSDFVDLVLEKDGYNTLWDSWYHTNYSPYVEPLNF